MSDLAVDRAWQRRGISSERVLRSREIVGEQVSLVLLSLPEAMTYYPAIGFEPLANACVVRRKS